MRYEARVVDHIVVRQRGAFGLARGAAGELDIDCVVCIQLALDEAQTVDLGRAGKRLQLLKAEHAGLRASTHLHDAAQLWQSLGLQFPWRAICQLRCQVPEHAQVVAALETDGADQDVNPCLVQRIFQFTAAVGGVDVDQDDPQAGRGKLGQYPFGTIGRPNAEALPALGSQAQKSRCHPVYGFRKLAPAPADPVLDKNKGGLSAMCFDSAVQQAADGLCHQVWNGGSAHMGKSAQWALRGYVHIDAGKRVAAHRVLQSAARSSDAAAR